MAGRANNPPKDKRKFANVVDFAQIMLNYHFEDSQRHFDHVKHITKLLCLRYNSLYSRHPLAEDDFQAARRLCGEKHIGILY